MLQLPPALSVAGKSGSSSSSKLLTIEATTPAGVFFNACLAAGQAAAHRRTNSSDDTDNSLPALDIGQEYDRLLRAAGLEESARMSDLTLGKGSEGSSSQPIDINNEAVGSGNQQGGVEDLWEEVDSVGAEANDEFLLALAIEEQAALDDRQLALALSRGEEPPTEASVAQLQLRTPGFRIPFATPQPIASESPPHYEDLERELTPIVPIAPIAPIAPIVPIAVPVTGNQATSGQLPQTPPADRSWLWDFLFGPWASPLRGSKPTKLVACLVCTDEFDAQTTLPTSCNHYYCTDCLVTMVQVAMRDESLYPLKCCTKPILEKAIIARLSKSLRDSFKTKTLELKVSPSDRVYCPVQTCSAFVGPRRMRTRNLSCPKCKKSVCTSCRQPSHRGMSCGQNEDKMVRTLASTYHWQTCPTCKALVDRTAGCNHMSCRCGTQFCYVCGQKWKSKSCRH